MKRKLHHKPGLILMASLWVAGQSCWAQAGSQATSQAASQATSQAQTQAGREAGGPPLVAPSGKVRYSPSGVYVEPEAARKKATKHHARPKVKTRAHKKPLIQNWK